MSRNLWYGTAILFTMLTQSWAAGGWTSDAVLHRVLDRGTFWTSLTADFKVKIVSGDTVLAAKGRIIYIPNEKIDVSFRKPWNRFFGNFYVTPSKVIYWDKNSSPRVASVGEEFDLATIVPISFPDWDPRDILPFVMSGRQVGFHADSIYESGKVTHVMGFSGETRHEIELSLRKGTVLRESVKRPGREPILKAYRKTRVTHGWPIPVRVECVDASDRFKLEWALSNVDLRALDFQKINSKRE